MDYRSVTRNFRLNCIVRVLTLGATITLLVVLLPRRQAFSLLLLGATIVGQTWSLIRYIESTNRSLSIFLQSVEFGDFSSRVISGPSGKSFSGLVQVFNEILAGFSVRDSAREENLRYLMAVVQHVGVGLLVHDDRDEVVLLNHAARRLLDVPRLGNLSDLQGVDPGLLAALRRQEPGEQILVTVTVRGEQRQLSIQASELRQSRRTLTLISLQNISPELNEKEMEAWRNLIRVLTHEIKNSLTPIISLAASVEKITVDEALHPVERPPRPDQVEKIRDALQIIQRRSQGLLHFVDSYRDLTNLPRPDISVFPVADLFSRVEALIAPQLAVPAGCPQADEHRMDLTVHIDPPTMKLTADLRLIEQVLINLVINALDATRGQQGDSIRLTARFDNRSRPLIEVRDNGPGILADSLEKVFIPFYSTKPDGTGIGLSWSRQVMRLHRGDLIARSEPGVETVFTLRF